MSGLVQHNSRPVNQDGRQGSGPTERHGVTKEQSELKLTARVDS